MSAVREKQAHIWDRQAEDWYCESDWCWDRLFQEENFVGRIHDPSCGRGNVVRSARAAGHLATGADIAPPEARGNPESYPVIDFISIEERPGLLVPNICSNPPFGIVGTREPAECYLRKALRMTTGKVALVMPTAWINARSWLRETPLYRVWWLTPRPSMPPGEVILRGDKPGNGTKDFAIYVWMHGYDGEPTFRWLHRDEVPA